MVGREEGSSGCAEADLMNVVNLSVIERCYQ